MESVSWSHSWPTNNSCGVQTITTRNHGDHALCLLRIYQVIEWLRLIIQLVIWFKTKLWISTGKFFSGIFVCWVFLVQKLNLFRHFKSENRNEILIFKLESKNSVRKWDKNSEKKVQKRENWPDLRLRNPVWPVDISACTESPDKFPPPERVNINNANIKPHFLVLNYKMFS